MRVPFHLLAFALAGMAPLAAQNAEFGPVLSVAQRTWPDKSHIGVVCNYAASQAMISELAQSAAPGTHITVVDTRSQSQLGSARDILADRKPDFLVVLPRDPIFFAGGFPATLLVHAMANKGVPSVGTRPILLQQGAVFCIGPETGGELLVTQRLTGTVSVILPNQQSKLAPSTLSMAPMVLGQGVTVSFVQAK